MSDLVSIHRLQKPSVLASQPALDARPVPTRKRPMIISASELRDWLRCRVKHHWRYQCRVVPIEEPENLAIGGAVHQLLEGWYRNPWKERTVKRMDFVVRNYFKGTTTRELDADNTELVKAMAIGYAAWARGGEDENIGLRECNPERWFELPLTDSGRIIVRGKLDNEFVVRALKRAMGVCEFKTKGQIRVDMVDMNLQLSVYLWALRRLHPKFRRFLAYYTILRKQMPGPRVRSELFHREAVERSDEEIEQWAIDTERAVMDMPGAAVYPSPMDSCGWDCDYQGPCLMRGNPSDLKFLFKTKFKRKGE